MKIDLHIHTNASDGSLTPMQVVREACEAGLDVIAVADHDTTAGVSEALEAGAQAGVLVVPAVEISATHPLGEVHLLGYWMDYRSPSFQAFLKKPFSSRPQRIVEMCGKLQELGVRVRPEEAFEEAGDRGSVGRPHLARVLLRKGYVHDMEEAFRRFLRAGAPAYVKRFKNSTAETLDQIHRHGGISVVAHPGLIEDPALVTALIEQGAMGIEAYCHEHDRAAQAGYEALASRHGLLVTGGSDYHGEMLGKAFKLGDLEVPAECYRRLEETHRQMAGARA